MTLPFFSLFHWTFLFLFLTMGAGCSSVPVFPPYPAQSPEAYPSQQEQQGLALAVSPMTDPQEMETYFGENLLSRGILPVFLVANNRHSQDIFLLDKQAMNLGHSRGMSDRPTPEDSSLEQIVGGVAVASILLFPPLAIPVMLFGGSAITHESERKRNIAVKEFRVKTLAPGRQTNGFLFFQLPEDALQDPSNSAQWFVQINVRETQQDQSHQFTFPIKLPQRPDS